MKLWKWGCLSLFMLSVVPAGAWLLLETLQHGDVPWAAAILLAIPLIFLAAVIIRLAGRFVRPLRGPNTGAVSALLVAAIAGGSIYAAVAGEVVVQRPDIAVVAAVRTACRGVAVPEAGRILSGGVRNHLVVLDAAGGDHDWTGHPPLTWRPVSVADVELVACIDRAETTTVVEVCRYTNGSSITRHSATRNVRLVEPASGRVLANLAVTSAAPACGKSEQKDLTDLYGFTGWADAQQGIETWLGAHGAPVPSGDP